MADVIAFDQARRDQAVRASRPAPPSTLGEIDDFAPDMDGLGAWVRAMFIEPDGPLYNPRHDHLRDARIGWLWTTADNTNRDRVVAGECQLVQPVQRKWGSARAHWLWQHWFGEAPHFVITISAPIAAELDDWSFCALIEHELCHAAQDVSEFGEPRFGSQGLPIFRVVSHDVEQFNDVVERYGPAASDVATMARLANAGPTMGEAQISAACGTCSRRTA